MDNDPSHVEISVNELKLLMNTLSKSVAVSLKKRFAWLWLFAGLLIGVIITLLIVTIAWKKTDNTSATSKSLLIRTEDISTASKSLLKKTDAVMSDLQQIHSDIDKLATSVTTLNQKTQPGSSPQLSSDIKPIESKIPQDNGRYSKYRVYLHYSELKNKEIMKNFSVFLKEKGFEVLGIQRVRYQHQDIRFFHEQDEKGAQILRKYLTGFVASLKNVKKEPIRIIDLGRKYPKAPNGSLEVWVDF
jgi:uncharacterized protein YoxC